MPDRNADLRRYDGAVRMGRRSGRGVVFAIGVVLTLVLSGCSIGSRPMTEDDIVERVARAQREAPTFTFTWVAAGPDPSDKLTTTGALRYQDGTLAAMRIRTTDAFDEVTEEYRLVDGTLYEGTSDGRFTPVQGSEAQEIQQAWDWAAAAEMYGDPLSVSEGRSEEADGVTAYDVTFDDDGEQITQTWWVDDQDRMLRFEAGEEDSRSVGTLTDYGKDVEITMPGDLVDR